MSDSKNIGAIEKLASFELESTFFNRVTTFSDVVQNTKKWINETLINQKKANRIIPSSENLKEINRYYILSLLKVIENDIYIYTQQLVDSVYGDPMVIRSLVNWLNEDHKRKLIILLKEQPSFNNDMFDYFRVMIKNKNQVKIKVAKHSEVISCNVNLLCADTNMYKIKEQVTDSNQENLVLHMFNSNAEKIKQALSELFDSKYSIEFNIFKQEKQIKFNISKEQDELLTTILTELKVG